MKLALIVATLMLAGCGQKNVHELLSNVDKDCIIHGTFSAATGVPGSVTVAGTIDCAPNGGVKSPGAGVPSPTNPGGGLQP